jgi:hypothetical protein
MIKPKKNPVTKLVAAGAKAVSKATILGIKSGRSTGKVKAVLRSNDKLGVNKITKGSNRGIAKKASSALPAAKTSRRATLKEVNLNNRFNKHPLVRNTGEASSETKYRVMRGNPIPVKPKNKKPNTVALGAAFGKKPNKSNKAK